MTIYYPDLTVQQLVKKVLEETELSREYICKNCDFKNPQMLSMIKSGKTIFPIGKSAQFAKILGLDPYLFYLKCLQEFKTEQYEALMMAMKLSAHEMPLSNSEANFIVTARAMKLDLAKILEQASEQQVES